MAARSSSTSTDFSFAYSADRQVFRTRKYSLILQNQGHRKHQIKLFVQGRQEQLAGCTLIASQCRNHHVRIEYVAESHICMISQAISRYNGFFDATKEF